MSAILGTALAVGGAAYGAISSALGAKQRRLYLDNYEREAMNDVNNDIYKDYSQTATAQSAMSNMRRLLLGSEQSLAGQQSVMGGNRAAVAEKKQQINDTLAQAGSNIVVNGEQQANQAKAERRSLRQWVAGQRMGIAQAQADNAAKAGAQLAGVGFDMISDSMGKKLMLGDGKDNTKFTPNDTIKSVGNPSEVGTQKTKIGEVNNLLA